MTYVHGLPYPDYSCVLHVPVCQRTIFVLSFRFLQLDGLYETYLGESPFVEQRRADIDRTDYPPAAERTMGIVKPSAIAGRQVAGKPFLAPKYPAYHAAFQAKPEKQRIRFPHGFHTHHPDIRLSGGQRLPYRAAVDEQPLTHLLIRGNPGTAEHKGRQCQDYQEKRINPTCTSHRLMPISGHTGSVRMRDRCSDARTPSSRGFAGTCPICCPEGNGQTAQAACPRSRT